VTPPGGDRRAAVERARPVPAPADPNGLTAWRAQ
jgi:hypothetical protein